MIKISIDLEDETLIQIEAEPIDLTNNRVRFPGIDDLKSRIELTQSEGLAIG
jgi:hypothetical protein